ncbi:MAG: PLP-dependent aminotransferase family protein, partial [Frankia sp.]
PVGDARVERGWQRPIVDQLVLAELIASGGYDRQVRRMRLRYRRRRDLLVAELAHRAPTVRVSGIAAGLHVIVELPPDGPGERATIAAGLDRGLALYGLSTTGYPHSEQSGSRRPALVVGYATPAEHTYRSAVDALVTLLADLTPARA